MNKDELNKYLKDNIELSINVAFDMANMSEKLEVSLYLENELLDSDSIYISEFGSDSE